MVDEFYPSMPPLYVKRYGFAHAAVMYLNMPLTAKVPLKDAIKRYHESRARLGIALPLDGLVPMISIAG